VVADEIHYPEVDDVLAEVAHEAGAHNGADFLYIGPISNYRRAELWPFCQICAGVINASQIHCHSIQFVWNRNLVDHLNRVEFT
jgi:hypothetical protein